MPAAFSGRWRIIGVLAVALLLGASAASAQAGSPLWLRFFEDTNGDGALSPGEPAITGDVAVTLEDADGVIIASTLLSEAPTATQGVIGLQGLAPGTYTIRITSAAYDATTETTFTREVTADGPSQVIEYGAVKAPPQPTESSWRGPFGLPVYLGAREQVARAAAAISAALLVAAVMAALGFVIYALVLRRRHRARLRRLASEA